MKPDSATTQIAQKTVSWSLVLSVWGQLFDSNLAHFYQICTMGFFPYGFFFFFFFFFFPFFSLFIIFFLFFF